jgi:WhiB family redox-sensing transcriptional regulator
MELMHSDMPNWVEYGQPLCQQVDPDLFFPIRDDDPIHLRMIKKICDSCKLKQKCFEYALNDLHIVGIWGGTTWSQREAIRRQRRSVA